MEFSALRLSSCNRYYLLNYVKLFFYPPAPFSLSAHTHRLGWNSHRKAYPIPSNLWGLGFTSGQSWMGKKQGRLVSLCLPRLPESVLATPWLTNAVAMPTLITLYGISCHICMNNSLKEERRACNFTAEWPLWPYVFRWLLLLPCVWETKGAITAIVTLTWGGAGCQKTSSLILASACIKTTFTRLLKTQEAHFEIKIHGRRKTWNVSISMEQKQTTQRELPTANNCRFWLAAKTGSSSYHIFLLSASN